jgi:hypothetical protein
MKICPLGVALIVVFSGCSKINLPPPSTIEIQEGTDAKFAQIARRAGVKVWTISLSADLAQGELWADLTTYINEKSGMQVIAHFPSHPRQVVVATVMDGKDRATWMVLDDEGRGPSGGYLEPPIEMHRTGESLVNFPPEIKGDGSCELVHRELHFDSKIQQSFRAELRLSTAPPKSKAKEDFNAKNIDLVQTWRVDDRLAKAE